MIIDESEIDKEGCYNESLALACLLAADVCFLNVVDLSKAQPEYYKEKKLTTAVYVHLPDDSECIECNDNEPDSEIISLYKMWKENNNYGAIKWACLKRGIRPPESIVKEMKKQNYWSEELEKLPTK